MKPARLIGILKPYFTFSIQFFQANGYPDYFESNMVIHQIWMWCQDRQFGFEQISDEIFTVSFKTEDDYVLFKLTWM